MEITVKDINIVEDKNGGYDYTRTIEIIDRRKDGWTVKSIVTEEHKMFCGEKMTTYPFKRLSIITDNAEYVHSVDIDWDDKRGVDVVSSKWTSHCADADSKLDRKLNAIARHFSEKAYLELKNSGK